jgi:acetyl-CoA carboxylase biotin carboxyl carrier protein
MEIKEIQNLIKFVAKSGATEVKLETKDFKITIKTGSDRGDYTDDQPFTGTHGGHSVEVPATHVVLAPKVESSVSGGIDKSKFLIIKSPIIGTFYRKSSPDTPPFVQIGDHINVGDTVCIIEAMKLFNEVESEVAGKIVEVLVDDTSPVEFDQALFLVDPTK